MKQVITGYKILYENGYVHRDIKPENIMKKGDCYKLGDFGICEKIDQKNTKLKMEEFLGSPLYESP